MSKVDGQIEQPPARSVKWRSLRSDAHKRNLATGTVFALLLGTICAQHWLASLPLPWGGPNVVIAGAATLAAALYGTTELPLAARRHPGRRFNISGMLERRRDALGLTPAALGALAVSAVMAAWALGVYLWNGNFELYEWGKLAMGGGVLLAVCIAVNSARRAGIALLAIMLAVWVSAVFGLALAAVPERLAYWWVVLADPAERTIGAVATEGRTSGLAVETAIFGQQLAVAIPLAMAALVGGAAAFAPSFFAGTQMRWRRRVAQAALFAALATLAVALVINGTRAAEYSTAAAIIIGLPLLWRVRRWRKPALWSLGLLVLCLLAAFNPVFDAGDLTGRIKAAAGDRGEPHAAGITNSAPRADYGTSQNGNRGGTIFANLKAGGRCDDAAATTRLCYRILGLNSRRSYVVQLRAQYLDGHGSEIGETMTHPSPGQIKTVSWDKTDDPGIAGYEFRLQPEGASGFTPWRKLADREKRGWEMTINADGAKMAALRTALDLSEFEYGRNIASLYAFGGWSLRSRLYQNAMAFRYAMDYPLGAGKYAPDKSHIGTEVNARDEAFLLNAVVHNQFLRTLTLYGYPGLLLLGALYALAVWSLGRAVIKTLRQGDETLFLMAAAVSMALTAYLAVSMLNAPGPFSGDWSHFLLLGLAFCIERIATKNQDKTGGESVVKNLSERYFSGAMPGRNFGIAVAALAALLAVLNVYAPAEPTGLQRLLGSLIIILCAVPTLRWIAGHAEQSLMPYLGILTGLYFGSGMFIRRDFFGQWLNGPRIEDSLIEVALLVALGGWALLLAGYYGMGYGRLNGKLPRVNITGPNSQRITMWLAVGIGIFAAPFLYFDNAHVSAFYAGITLLPAAIAFPVNLISEMTIFSILILYYLLLRGELNTVGKIFLALLSAYYLVLGLSTGLILQGLTAIFALFVAHAMVAPRPTWRVALYGCLTAALVFFVLVPLRDNFRTLIWTHGVDPAEDRSWRQSAHEIKVSAVDINESEPIIRSSDYSVFLRDGVLTYAHQDPGLCNEAVENERETAFFIHLVPFDVNLLPAARVAHGFDNLDFALREVGEVEDGQCVHRVALPDYEIDTIRSGIYLRNLEELAPVRQELQNYVATRREVDASGEWNLRTRDAASWELAPLESPSDPPSRLIVFLDDEIELNNALWIQPGYTLQIRLDEDNWAHYAVGEVVGAPGPRLVFLLAALVDSGGDRSALGLGASAIMDYSILKAGLQTPAPAVVLPNVSTETFEGPGRNPTAPIAQESQVRKTLAYLSSLGRLVDQPLDQLPFGLGRALISATYRLDFLVPLAYLMSQAPERIPYLWGETYYPILLKAVPRAIYPDKPEDVTDLGQRYAFLPEGNEINAFKVHQIGEMYINFGIAGVLLGMLILGALFRALFRLFFHSGATAVTMAAGALIMTKLLLGMEDLASPVLGFIMWYAALLALLWAGVRLAHRVWPASRPAPQEEAAGVAQPADDAREEAAR